MKNIILTVNELAEYGVSAAAIYKARDAGRIAIRSGRIKVVEALVKLTKEQDPTKPDRLLKALELAVADKGGSVPESEPSEPQSADDNRAIAEARRRHEWAKAGLAELELDAQRRIYVKREEILAGVDKLIRASRSRLLRLPVDVAQLVAIEADPVVCQQILDGAVRDCLEDLSKWTPDDPVLKP